MKEYILKISIKINKMFWLFFWFFYGKMTKYLLFWPFSHIKKGEKGATINKEGLFKYSIYQIYNKLNEAVFIP